jgi:hypothetical protein
VTVVLDKKGGLHAFWINDKGYVKTAKYDLKNFDHSSLGSSPLRDVGDQLYLHSMYALDS